MRRRRLRSLRLEASVLAENEQSIVLRLGETPFGDEGRAVTVLVHPDLAADEVAEELRTVLALLEQEPAEIGAVP